MILTVEEKVVLREEKRCFLVLEWSGVVGIATWAVLEKIYIK